MSDQSSKDYKRSEAKRILYDLFGSRRVGAKGLRKLRAQIEGTAVELWEQNTRKTSQYAERARNGERIAWMFRNGEFYGRVSDTEGVVILDDEPPQDEPADPLLADKQA